MNGWRRSGPQGSTCSVPWSQQVLPSRPSVCLTNGASSPQPWSHASSKQPAASPDARSPPLHATCHQGGAGAGWSGARTQATAHGSLPALHTLAVRPWASHFTSLCLQAALLVTAEIRSPPRLSAGAGQSTGGGWPRGDISWTLHFVQNTKLPNEVLVQPPLLGSAFPGLTHGRHAGGVRWGRAGGEGRRVHVAATSATLPVHLPSSPIPCTRARRPKARADMPEAPSAGCAPPTVPWAPGNVCAHGRHIWEACGRSHPWQTLGHRGQEGSLGEAGPLLAAQRRPPGPFQPGSRTHGAPSQPAELDTWGQ